MATSPVIFHAHDKAEGSAPDFKEYLREFCVQKGLDTAKLRLNRYFNTTTESDTEPVTENRRVTREVLVFIFDKARVPDAERKQVWERYFNKPADSLYEHVRRAVIMYGNLDEFAKLVGTNHESINGILRGNAPTFDLLEKIAPQLSCTREQANALWREARGQSFLKRWENAPLAAHIELLMEENRTSVRQWTEGGCTLPPLMRHHSKNEVKNMFSTMRAGHPILWHQVESLLSALHPLPEDRKQRAHAMDRRRMITLSWARTVRAQVERENVLRFSRSIEKTPLHAQEDSHREMRTLAAVFLDAPHIDGIKAEELFAEKFDLARCMGTAQPAIAPVPTDESLSQNEEVTEEDTPQPQEPEPPKKPKLKAADLYAQFMEKPGIKHLRLEKFLDIAKLFRILVKKPDDRDAVLEEALDKLPRKFLRVAVRLKIEEVFLDATKEATSEESGVDRTE